MSAWIERVKGIFSSGVGDKAADVISEQVTPERIDSVLDRVPGSDMVRDHVPEDAGEQIGGAVRGFGADDNAKPPGS